MRHDHYHPGGYDPDAPHGNLAQSWDLTAGTYTGWAADGTVLEQRPLTDAETADLQVVSVAQQAASGVQTLGELVEKTITDNDTYLALPEPTGEQLVAQVRLLTRQVTALARYVGTVTASPAAQDYLSDLTDVTTP